MKKLRILLIFSMLILIAALAACGQDQKGTDNKNDEVVNLKSVAIQGDWAYHFKGDMRDPTAAPGLYKTKLDNSETIQISEDLGLFLILEGEWIYYSDITQDNTEAIYKIKTDGSEKTKLADDSIMLSMIGKGFEVEGDWLYYLSMKEEGSLNRIQIDDGNKQSLMEDQTFIFELKDDWIYYNVMEDGAGLYKMKNDGSEKSLVLEENVILMDVSKDYIYFTDESGDNLRRSNLDGTDIDGLDIDNVYLLQEEGDWIYYISQPNIPESDNQLYRFKVGEGDSMKLTDDDSFFMEVAQGWVYYISIDEASYSFKLNKMKADGSEKETFKVEGILVFLNW